ncbi:MAG: phosphoribosylglycinamide formyltransferase [Oligoflexales bacterium]|nr:phosphoribosylglycinamide formyltransferase [Oligoflexales bacterium]
MSLESKPAKIVVAASGAGRSLKNLIEAQNFYKSFEVSGLISSSERCGAVSIAKSYQLPVFVGTFDGSIEPSSDLLTWLKEIDPEWLVLAGFLKVFPVLFKGMSWEHKIINIHPSLLPKFGGKGMYGNRVHKAVMESGEAESGASIHFVNSQYDQGQIIAQARVPVLSNDDANSLAKRVFTAECKLYPQVIAGLIAGELPLASQEIKTC